MYPEGVVHVGRANIYLSDELERRVRAAKVPISEVCQQALTAAVEAAGAAGAPLGQAAADCFAAGWTAGGRWTTEAGTADLLRLLRDLTLPEIPRDLLPDSWFSWNDDQTLAWEAGFAEAARTAVRSGLVGDLPDPTPAGAPDPGRAGRRWRCRERGDGDWCPGRPRQGPDPGRHRLGRRGRGRWRF